MTQQIDDPMTAIGKLDGNNYYIYVQYDGIWFHERTVGTKARADERVDVLRKRGKTACYTKGQIISAPLNVNEDGIL